MHAEQCLVRRLFSPRGFSPLRGFATGVFFPGRGVGAPLPNLVVSAPCSVMCPGCCFVVSVILCVVILCCVCAISLLRAQATLHKVCCHVMGWQDV